MSISIGQDRRREAVLHAHDASTRGAALRLPALLVPALALVACGGGGGDGDGGGSGGPPGTGNPTVDADVIADTVEFLPDIVQAGQSLTVLVGARNLGPDSVSTFRMGVYLSLDESLSSGDEFIGSWTVPGLSAGQEVSTGGELEIPATTVPGLRRLLLVVDDLNAFTDNDEGNDVLAADALLTVDPPQLADLDIAEVSFSPSTLLAGDLVSVEDRVVNEGVVAAEAFRVGIYLSSDPTVGTGDVLLGHRTVEGLDPLASSEAVGNLTVPQAVAPGSYYIGAIADDLDQVIESTEADNVRVAVGVLEVAAAPAPELVGSSITFSPTSVVVGDTITVSEEVRNDGAVDADAFQVGVYLSPDSQIDPAEDILLGYRTVGSLTSGSSTASGQVTLTIPPEATNGSWYVAVMADDTGLVEEFDEQDNVLLALETLSVDVPPFADLVAESISFGPTQVQEGQTAGVNLDVTEAVRNASQQISGVVRVAVYLSDNAVISPGDTLLGVRDVGPLSGNATSEVTTSMPLPAFLNAGSYYVALFVDDLGTEEELNESNNLLLASSFLDVTTGTGGAPNLVVDSVNTASSGAAPGGTFQVASAVTNSGDTTAPGPITVGVYLSDDDEITSSDILIGTRVITFGLGGGFSSSASSPVTVPASTPDGTYRLGVLADVLDSVSESDESDNFRLRSGTFEITTPPPPGPNLRVTSTDLVGSGDVAPGETFDLEATIFNVGPLPAGAFRVAVHLSDDDTLDAADIVIATRQIASLDNGASSDEVLTVTVPAGTATGTYRLLVEADDEGVVTEQDEEDNVRLVTESLTVQ